MFESTFTFLHCQNCDRHGRSCFSAFEEPNAIVDSCPTCGCADEDDLRIISNLWPSDHTSATTVELDKMDEVIYLKPKKALQ